MNQRLVQGFTALQIVALDPERDVDMRDPAGNPALIDGDLGRPNPDYFAYLDGLLEMAEQMGLYVLLLPVWGQLVVGEDWGGRTYPRTVTADNAYGVRTNGSARGTATGRTSSGASEATGSPSTKGSTTATSGDGWRRGSRRASRDLAARTTSRRTRGGSC